MASVIIVNVLWLVYLCKMYYGKNCMASVIIENVLCNWSYGINCMVSLIMENLLWQNVIMVKSFMTSVIMLNVLWQM